MTMIAASQKVALKEILYLTDFSLPSTKALPFARSLARRHGATIRALHVLVTNRHGCSSPEIKDSLVRAETEIAETEMQRLESEIQDVAHQAKLVVQHNDSIWPAVEEAIRAYNTDLIVVGTHGRIGLTKQRFGSIAEEIFRRSSVPVLTIGPSVHLGVSKDDRFHRLLFATAFEPDSKAVVEYACQFAVENCAQLLLLHVISGREHKEGHGSVPSVAEIIHKLHGLIPRSAGPSCRSEGIVRYGEPSKQIIDTAGDRCADLVVMGVRDHAENLESVTHFEMTSAHKVIVGAPCPVLTIRRTVLTAGVTAVEGNFVNSNDHRSWLN